MTFKSRTFGQAKVLVPVPHRGAVARELSDKKQSKPDQVFIPWIAQPLNEFKLLADQAQKEGFDDPKGGLYSRLLQAVIDEIKVDHLIFGIQESVIRKTGLRPVADNTFVSRAGLVYEPEKKFGNRLLHVAAHLKADLTKRDHTIFLGDLSNVILLLDEAWGKKKNPYSNDELAYPIEMGKTIGTKGEKIIRLVLIKKNTQLIKTAYPVAQGEK